MSTVEIVPPLLEYPVPTRIGPDQNGMLMTPGEFDAIEDWDEDYRYEREEC